MVLTKSFCLPSRYLPYQPTSSSFTRVALLTVSLALTHTHTHTHTLTHALTESLSLFLPIVWLFSASKRCCKSLEFTTFTSLRAPLLAALILCCKFLHYKKLDSSELFQSSATIQLFYTLCCNLKKIRVQWFACFPDAWVRISLPLARVFKELWKCCCYPKWMHCFLKL